MPRHFPDRGADADADQTGTTSPVTAGTVVASTFEEQAPALPNEMADLRRKLTRWLGGFPLGPDSKHDITLATYEALSNVAAHAYPGGHGWARLQATCSGDAVTVTVTDTGCGIPATRQHQPGLRTSGGRGLLLIEKVADRSDINTGDQGTEIRMTWHPAALRTACRT